jgi:hypothetical protein
MIATPKKQHAHDPKRPCAKEQKVSSSRATFGALVTKPRLTHGEQPKEYRRPRRYLGAKRGQFVFPIKPALALLILNAEPEFRHAPMLCAEVVTGDGFAGVGFTKLLAAIENEPCVEL